MDTSHNILSYARRKNRPRHLAYVYIIVQSYGYDDGDVGEMADFIACEWSVSPKQAAFYAHLLSSWFYAGYIPTMCIQETRRFERLYEQPND